MAQPSDFIWFTQIVSHRTRTNPQHASTYIDTEIPHCQRHGTQILHRGLLEQVSVQHVIYS